jgi:hypothetical protein
MMSGMNPEELAEMQKMQSNFSLEGLKRNLEKKTQELSDGASSGSGRIK